MSSSTTARIRVHHKKGNLFTGQNACSYRLLTFVRFILCSHMAWAEFHRSSFVCNMNLAVFSFNDVLYMLDTSVYIIFTGQPKIPGMNSPPKQHNRIKTDRATKPPTNTFFSSSLAFYWAIFLKSAEERNNIRARTQTKSETCIHRHTIFKDISFLISRNRI